MILGMLPICWEQNTDTEDYKYFSSQLIKHLQNRRYKLNEIAKSYQRAAQQINLIMAGQYTLRTTKDKKLPDDTLIFHIPFHPHGISNAETQQTFTSTCMFSKEQIDNWKLEHDTSDITHGTGNLNINRLIIAQQRPNNIANHLCPLKMFTIRTKTVSNTLNQLQQQHN